ncbi:MAG TPA: nitroreductase family protein [Acidimicrobiia bacterium]|jgi:nitroreductase
MTELDRATIDTLLSTTRAVRKRLDLSRPVEREVVLECLRLAIQAPTGGNAQGWRWIVVTDAEKRARLAELYRRSWGPYSAASRAQTDPASQQGRVIDSAQFLADHLEEVPVHVIPCIYGRQLRAGSLTDAAGLFGSIFPAVWSFQLALRSRGLGSVLTTLHLPFADEAAQLLDIPEGVVQTALIPVAYFTGESFHPAQRRPVEEITYWNGWKQS